MKPEKQCDHKHGPEKMYDASQMEISKDKIDKARYMQLGRKCLECNKFFQVTGDGSIVEPKT